MLTKRMVEIFKHLNYIIMIIIIIIVDTHYGQNSLLKKCLNFVFFSLLSNIHEEIVEIKTLEIMINIAYVNCFNLLVFYLYSRRNG